MDFLLVEGWELRTDGTKVSILHTPCNLAYNVWDIKVAGEGDWLLNSLIDHVCS